MENHPRTDRSHSLRFYGAPHTEEGKLVNPEDRSTAGVGRALCSCGEMSEPLESGLARRGWYAEHRAENPPPEPEPVLQETPDGGEVVKLSFPSTVAKHFWRQLAVDPMRRIAQENPGVEYSLDERNLLVTISGDWADIAAENLRDVWEYVLEREQPWRELLEPGREPEPGNEARRVRAELMREQFTELAEQALEEIL